MVAAKGLKLRSVEILTLSEMSYQLSAISQSKTAES
jgi:hypothetical protein